MKKNRLIFVFLLLSSCVVVKYSGGSVFYDCLEKDCGSDKIAPESKEIARSFNQFNSLSRQINKLYKFNEGCYMIRMVEKDTLLHIRGKDIPIKTFKSKNTIDPAYADKIIYLVFLDNERVIYHSPYRKNYIKTGEIGRVEDYVSRRKKYASKTENYIKLDTDYEFNSYKRGYYKITNDRLYVWLERGDNDKKLCLLRMDFKFYSDEENPLKIGSLAFENAEYQKQTLDISDLFGTLNDDKALTETKQTKNIDHRSSGIIFEYFKIKFRPIIVSKNRSLVASIKDTTINGNKTKLYFINCDKDGCEKNIMIPENRNDLFTY